jgi:hypothetical protein
LEVLVQHHDSLIQLLLWNSQRPWPHHAWYRWFN